MTSKEKAAVARLSASATDSDTIVLLGAIARLTAPKSAKSGRYTRTRGYQFERETVNYLREGGLSARRVPLSGAGEEKGDITVTPGYAPDMQPLRGELKRKKALPDWIVGPLGEHDFMAMRADASETLVIVRLSLFRDLLQ